MFNFIFPAFAFVVEWQPVPNILLFPILSSYDYEAVEAVNSVTASLGEEGILIYSPLGFTLYDGKAYEIVFSVVYASV